MDEDDEAVEFIQYLVEEGGLILDGMDENGEPTYKHDLEVLSRIAPEYVEILFKDIEDSLISLYEKGMVSLEITDSGEVVWFANHENLNDV